MRQLLFFLPTLILLLLPSVTLGAEGLVTCTGVDIPGTDEIPCGTCEFVSTINRVYGFLITLAAIVATIALVYTGLKLVTSAGSEEAKSHAKKTLWTIFIGLIFIIGAFAIIDVVIRVLVPEDSEIRNWRNYNKCIYATVPSKNATPEPLGLVVGDDGGVTAGGRGIAQCEADNENCSVGELRSLGLTEVQANVMSCVAVTENAGNASGCSGTGPCGTFQITKTNWRNYTSGTNPQVAGCSAEIFGGNIESAQNYGACNARVMVEMVKDVGYQPWTGQSNQGVAWNTNARKCVNNYSTTGDTTPRGF